MSWMGKLVGGGLGWALFGPLGALIGGVIGNAFDAREDQAGMKRREEIPRDYYRHHGWERDDPRFQANPAGNFVVALLALCAHVMRADGTVRGEEVRQVRAFVQRTFPHDAADLMQVLRQLLERPVDVGPLCAQIAAHLGHAERLELLNLLVAVARADGILNPAETASLREIARRLGIREPDLRRVFGASATPQAAAVDPYEVLGLPRAATDEEAKKAWRALAKKHHPDRVAHLGEDVRRHSEERFKAIQAAWEQVKQERGL
jgi:DnaJ like chaperone protein